MENEELSRGTLTSENSESVIIMRYLATSNGWYGNTQDSLVELVALRNRKVPFESADAVLAHLIEQHMDMLRRPIDYNDPRVIQLKMVFNEQD